MFSLRIGSSLFHYGMLDVRIENLEFKNLRPKKHFLSLLGKSSLYRQSRICVTAEPADS